MYSGVWYSIIVLYRNVLNEIYNESRCLKERRRWQAVFGEWIFNVLHGVRMLNEIFL